MKRELALLAPTKWVPEPGTSRGCDRCGSVLEDVVINGPPPRRAEKNHLLAKGGLRKAVTQSRAARRKCAEAGRAATAGGGELDAGDQRLVQEFELANERMRLADERVQRAQGRVESTGAAARQPPGPLSRQLPATHTSRDVKFCRHCGEIDGIPNHNRDVLADGNIGFRGTTEGLCGLPCPSRLHPAALVRNTGRQKIDGINVLIEIEHIIFKMERLWKAERLAQSLAQSAVTHSRGTLADGAAAALRIAWDRILAARMIKQQASDIKARLVHLSTTLQSARDEHVAMIERQAPDRMSEYQLRQAVYREADDAANRAVGHLLDGGGEVQGEARVVVQGEARVVSEAKRAVAALRHLKEGVKRELRTVADTLKRWKGVDKTGRFNVRFSNKTKFASE